MLMYLIHLNNPEKTQYTIEEVKGELKGELAEILYKREPIENKLTIIMQNIIQDKISNIQELMIYGIETGNYEIIRKYQYILMQCIKERKIENVNKKFRESIRRKKD